MNRTLTLHAAAIAVAGTLCAASAVADTNCGPQANAASNEVPVVSMDTLQTMNSDRDLVGKMNNDGSLTVFQLVPFAVVADAGGMNGPSQNPGPSAAPQESSPSSPDAVIVVPAQ